MCKQRRHAVPGRQYSWDLPRRGKKEKGGKKPTSVIYGEGGESTKKLVHHNLTLDVPCCMKREDWACLTESLMNCSVAVSAGLIFTALIAARGTGEHEKSSKACCTQSNWAAILIVPLQEAERSDWMGNLAEDSDWRAQHLNVFHFNVQ